MTVVVDASALLALLFDEPGADGVAEAIATGATVSAVNLGEVATVLVRTQRDPHAILIPLRAQVDVEPFTDEDALAIAALHPQVSGRGLSLGDRACLALAERLRIPVLTADQAWADLPIDVAVRLVRSG